MKSQKKKKRNSFLELKKRAENISIPILFAPRCLRMQWLELLQLHWENEETKQIYENGMEEPGICCSASELIYLGIFLSWDILLCNIIFLFYYLSHFYLGVLVSWKALNIVWTSGNNKFLPTEELLDKYLPSEWMNAWRLREWQWKVPRGIINFKLGRSWRSHRFF